MRCHAVLLKPGLIQPVQVLKANIIFAIFAVSLDSINTYIFYVPKVPYNPHLISYCQICSFSKYMSFQLSYGSFIYYNVRNV